MKVLSFYFQDLKKELKNPVSTKSYGPLKMVYIFSAFVQEILQII